MTLSECQLCCKFPSSAPLLSFPLYALMRKLHWQPQSQRQRQHRRQRQRQRKAICLIAYRRFMASVWREKNKAKRLERW